MSNVRYEIVKQEQKGVPLLRVYLEKVSDGNIALKVENSWHEAKTILWLQDGGTIEMSSGLSPKLGLQLDNNGRVVVNP